jgi:hypothetical protein
MDAPNRTARNLSSVVCTQAEYSLGLGRAYDGMSASHRPTMASSLPSLSPLRCAGESHTAHPCEDWEGPWPNPIRGSHSWLSALRCSWCHSSGRGRARNAALRPMKLTTPCRGACGHASWYVAGLPAAKWRRWRSHNGGAGYSEQGRFPFRRVTGLDLNKTADTLNTNPFEQTLTVGGLLLQGSYFW